MALTDAQQRRLAELRAKFGKGQAGAPQQGIAAGLARLAATERKLTAAGKAPVRSYATPAGGKGVDWSKVAGAAGAGASKIGGGLAAAGGAAYSGVKGAAGWALGFGVTQDAFDSIKDPGFIIFLMSLPIYFGGLLASLSPAFVPIAEVSFFMKAFASSLLFLPLVVIFVQKGRGLFFTAAFVAWYLFLGASLDPFALVWITGIYLGLMIASTLLGKSKHQDIAFTGVVSEDITNAIIPIALFFADVGAIHWLQQRFKLEFLIGILNVINFLPIWTIYGIFQTKRESAIINFLKFGTVIYVVSILMIGLVPNLPVIVSDLRAPAVEEFQKAKEESLAKLPKGENPFISQLACIFSGEGANLNDCVKGRQALSRCKAMKKEDVADEENEEYQRCLRIARGEESELSVEGGIEESLGAASRVEIKVDERFPSQLYDGKTAVLLEFVVETPRKDIGITVSCEFAVGENVIVGQPSTTRITATKGASRHSVSCLPTSELNEGSATLKVKANIEGLQTYSYLKRAFIGMYKTKEQGNEIKKDYFPGKQDVSLSPQEFARINFAIGYPPSEPLIKGNADIIPQLAATIENLGGGKIIGINRVQIDLVEGLTLSNAQSCGMVPKDKSLVKEDFVIGDFADKKEVPLAVCSLSMDDKLRAPENFLIRDFIALIEYKYEITKEFSFTVKKIRI